MFLSNFTVEHLFFSVHNPKQPQRSRQNEPNILLSRLQSTVPCLRISSWDAEAHLYSDLGGSYSLISNHDRFWGVGLAQCTDWNYLEKTAEVFGVKFAYSLNAKWTQKITGLLQVWCMAEQPVTKASWWTGCIYSSLLQLLLLVLVCSRLLADHFSLSHEIGAKILFSCQRCIVPLGNWAKPAGWFKSGRQPLSYCGC